MSLFNVQNSVVRSDDIIESSNIKTDHHQIVPHLPVPKVAPNQSEHGILVFDQSENSIVKIDQSEQSIVIIDQSEHSIAVSDQSEHSIVIIDQSEHNIFRSELAMRGWRRNWRKCGHLEERQRFNRLWSQGTLDFLLRNISLGRSFSLHGYKIVIIKNIMCYCVM